MEFGAKQCTPKNVDCHVCPLNSSCLALKKGKVYDLPIKLKSAKAKKKFFNFLVFISDNGQTILEKRTGRGIWQNLYQFPLIETKKELDTKAIEHSLEGHPLLKDSEFDVALYNDTTIVHKLSHQHLYTKFYIVSIKELAEGIPFDEVHQYAVPVLIGNFIENFNFN